MIETVIVIFIIFLFIYVFNRIHSEIDEMAMKNMICPHCGSKLRNDLVLNTSRGRRRFYECDFCDFVSSRGEEEVDK